MGFNLRKSVKVGPFRLNVSTSGIGVSAGIKGLRVGTGPRGNYVHMGREGLYYRKSFPSSSGQTSSRCTASDASSRTVAESVSFTPIGSSPIEGLVDSSSAELVAEINAKRQAATYWPSMAIGGLVASISALLIIPDKTQSIVAFGLLCGLIISLSLWISTRDKIRKTTVLFYDFDPEMEKLYQQMHDVIDSISLCSRIWHVEGETPTEDRKHFAGAVSMVVKSRIYVTNNPLPHVTSNIDAPCLPLGSRKMFFFPDKVLILDSYGVGAVSYKNLKIELTESRFVEQDDIPDDAKSVGTTWRYLNKNGGPDKRFKDNKELPLVLYENIHFRSDSGLNERISLSRTGLGEKLNSAIRALSEAIQEA